MTQADCDIVVTLCLRMIKHMNNKLRWLSEPLPGARTSAASGEKYTPHAQSSHHVYTFMFDHEFDSATFDQ
jgi:hypothetical protein